MPMEFCNVHKQKYICYVFAYVLNIFPTSPSPMKVAASGTFHNIGPAAFGRQPTVVESIMGCGKAANMSKTKPHPYRIDIFVYTYCHLFHLPFTSLLELSN